MSRSLLIDAWKAGTVSRLTMIFGLILSGAWATFIALVTIKFILNTIQQPGLVPGYKVALLVLLAVAVLILVIPIPAQWLMYVLLRLLERRRGASGPGA